MASNYCDCRWCFGGPTVRISCHRSVIPKDSALCLCKASLSPYEESASEQPQPILTISACIAFDITWGYVKCYIAVLQRAWDADAEPHTHSGVGSPINLLTCLHQSSSVLAMSFPKQAHRKWTTLTWPYCVFRFQQMGRRAGVPEAQCIRSYRIPLACASDWFWLTKSWHFGNEKLGSWNSTARWF